MHARKMAARLEEAQRGSLVRVRSCLAFTLSAGHGQGKPASKLVEQLVDELGFPFGQFGVRQGVRRRRM